MNQQPPGFGVASDNYQGAGQKGGTVPGGPPDQIQPFGNYGFTQLAPDGQSVAAGTPGVVSPTVPDTHGVPMAQPSFGQPVASAPLPYPAIQPLPPMMHGAGAARPKKNSVLPVVLVVGGVLSVMAFVGVGVFLYSRSSSSSSQATDPPAITFAPAATVEPEYVAPAQTTETPVYVPPEPPVAPPPATTAKPKPKPQPTAIASSTPQPIPIVRPDETGPGTQVRIPPSSGNKDNSGSSTRGTIRGSSTGSSGRGSIIRLPADTD